MVHICFAIYDATGLYSKFTGTALLSIFENHNTPPINHRSYPPRQHADNRQP